MEIFYIVLLWAINSSPPSAAYMRQCIDSDDGLAPIRQAII